MALSSGFLNQWMGNVDNERIGRFLEIGRCRRHFSVSALEWEGFSFGRAVRNWHWTVPIVRAEGRRGGVVPSPPGLNCRGGFVFYANY